MNDDLGSTRQQLRGLLIQPDTREPGRRRARELHGQFPRSKVMQFAFNPRNRKVLSVTGSVMAVLLSRVVSPGRMHLFKEIVRTIARDPDRRK